MRLCSWPWCRCGPAAAVSGRAWGKCPCGPVWSLLELSRSRDWLPGTPAHSHILHQCHRFELMHVLRFCSSLSNADVVCSSIPCSYQRWGPGWAMVAVREGRPPVGSFLGPSTAYLCVWREAALPQFPRVIGSSQNPLAPESVWSLHSLRDGDWSWDSITADTDLPCCYGVRGDPRGCTPG